MQSAPTLGEGLTDFAVVFPLFCLMRQPFTGLQKEFHHGNRTEDESRPAGYYQRGENG